ncbi:MAG TPA: DUF1800 domain-containing protein [Caulobacteraceae bacterium]|nr:DUF1800 domain-containing protein [Caulobacteraceae bacterium]
MSLDQAAIAANRFGLGARPGELKTIAGDPRGWLKAQLQPEASPPPPLQALPTTAAAAGEFVKWLVALGLTGRQGDLAKLYQNRDRPGDASGGQMAAAPTDGGGQPLSVEQSYVKYFSPGYADGVEARFLTATTSQRPFFDRLSRFWANHFTISAAKPEIIALAPLFERDVVRPHVCGRFEDMLLASCRHPGMLMYLDNYLSIGPNSPLAHHPEYLPAFLRDRMKGLNENLGRELLELHTLGVRSGYTQADVTTLAKIITGWSIYGPGQTPPNGDVFHYIDFAHEPGPQTLLGKTYPAAGEAQGRSALKDLAHHPATATHLATKLARHFIADDPPPAAVARIAAAYTASGGDLAATAAAIVDSPEAWAAPKVKLKTPDDYLVSTVRALDGPPLKGFQLIALLDRMGQRPFWAPGPDGWPDIQDGWIGADAIWKRLEWASRLSQDRAAADVDPLTIAQSALGPELSPATASAIRAADSPAQGLALFLVSADFQRR